MNSDPLSDIPSTPVNDADISRYLDKSDPEVWRFKFRKSRFLIFLLILLPSVIAGAVSGQLIFILLPAFFIAAIILCTFKKFLRTPTFDFRYRCYHCDWRKNEYGDPTLSRGYVPFSDIAGIQVLSKIIYGSKGHSRTAYELNLIKKDRSRIGVIADKDQEQITAHAAAIAKKLEIPLIENHENKVLSKPTPLWLGILFLVLFGGAGIMAFYSTVAIPLCRNHQTQSWIETPAVVTSGKISSMKRRSKNGSYTVYKAEITYCYRFNDKVYSCSNYDMFHDFSQIKSTQVKLLKEYPVGKTFFCYVDPESPQNAVVSRKVNFFEVFQNTALSAFFIIAGTAAFVIILISRCKKK